MQITIEFFGVLRSLAGTGQASITLAPGSSVAEACAMLATRFPDMAERLTSTACAVGDSLVARSTPLVDGTTLVLIPPVSGG